MRADGVLRLLLNSKLYKGLNPTVEGKTVLMTLPNVGEKEMAIICLRVCLSSPPPPLFYCKLLKQEISDSRCQMQKSQKSSQTISTNISPSIAPTHQSHRNPPSDKHVSRLTPFFHTSDGPTFFYNDKRALTMYFTYNAHPTSSFIVFPLCKTHNAQRELDESNERPKSKLECTYVVQDITAQNRLFNTRLHPYIIQIPT